MSASASSVTWSPPQGSESERYERLVRVVQDLSLARSAERVRDLVRHAARDLLGADGATFVLRDGDACHYVDEDAIAPLWKGRRFPLSACVSGWVMLQRRAVAIEDVYADPRVPTDAYRPTFVVSLAMVPIRREEPLGAVGTYWSRRRQTSAWELHLLQALADSTSIALENVARTAELEAARERAEEASRLKDEFLRTVGHELRTPLNPILGWASLLRGERGPADDVARAAEAIERNARKELRLVEDLLDASQIAGGGLPLSLAEVDLEGVLRRVVASFEPAAREKGVAVEAALEPARAIADADRVAQVARNQLSNAIKFTPPGGCVAGSLRREDSVARLEVADDGEGIAGEFLPSLFEPFRQADGSTTRRAGGLGIGLSIAAHLVERHGGRIEARSAGRGKGATFVVRLPLANPSVRCLAPY